MVTPSSWAATVSIANATGAAVRLTTPAAGTSPVRGLGVLRKNQWRGQTGLVYLDRRIWLEHDAAPSQLPRSIAKGETWTGTIGGRAKLRKGVDYRLAFGWFDPLDADAGGAGFYWITDHSFHL